MVPIAISPFSEVTWRAKPVRFHNAGSLTGSLAPAPVQIERLNLIKLVPVN